MLAPKYRVLVDWGGASSVIRVGSGRVGGPEVITAGSASDLFDGVYDSRYSDVTTDVLEGKIQRKLGPDGIVESTIDLTLTDAWPGKYNAKNPGILGNSFVNPKLAVDMTGWNEYINATNNLLAANDQTFEAAGSWFFAGGGTGSATLDATHVRSGAKALKVVTNGDASNQGADGGIGAGGPACAPGTSYGARAWVYSLSAMSYMINLAWYDSSGAFLSNTIQTWAVPANSFTAISVSATAPASAAHVGVRVRVSGSTAATFWIDDAQIWSGSITGGSDSSYTRVAAAGTPYGASWAARLSANVYANGPGSLVPAQILPVDNSATYLPVTPGQTVFARLSCRWPGGGQTMQRLGLAINWRTAPGGLFVASTTVETIFNPVSGQWYALSGSAVCPPGAGWADMSMVAYINGGGNIIMEATEAQIVADVDPGFYVDGDQYDCRWSGTAGTSTSYYGAPLYGLILPGRRCEVDVSFDNGTSWAPICGGWLSETESDPDYGSSQARLNFTDLAYLDRPVPAIASTGPTTVAAALGLVHDAISWDGTRDFHSTAPLADFSTDGTTTAREVIAELIKVDLGFYYVSKGNVATYVDKYEYARRASFGIFEAMGSSVPGVSLKSIINGASAQKGSGPVQTYQDSISRGKYGPLDDPAGEIQSDWFSDDAAALSNATWRVQIAKDPVGAYWQFQPIPSDDANLQAAIGAEMLDVATIQPISLPAEDQQCQWIIHDFGGGKAHIVTWRLRELPAMKPIIVGSSTVGGANVIAT